MLALLNPFTKLQIWLAGAGIGLAVLLGLFTWGVHVGKVAEARHAAPVIAGLQHRLEGWRDATHAWQAAVGRQNKALDHWKAERDRKVSDAEKAAHQALRGQKAVEGRVEKLLHAKLSGKDVCERFEEADKLVLGGLR